jgi:hypothetical protein
MKTITVVFDDDNVVKLKKMKKTCPGEILSLKQPRGIRKMIDASKYLRRPTHEKTSELDSRRLSQIYRRVDGKTKSLEW